VILILIPVAGLVLGLVLWGAMRGLGAFNVLGAEPAGRSHAVTRDRVPTSIRERIEDMPRAFLLTVIIASGVWVLAWLILLLVGLSVLS